MTRLILHSLQTLMVGRKTNFDPCGKLNPVPFGCESPAITTKPGARVIKQIISYSSRMTIIRKNHHRQNISIFKALLSVFLKPWVFHKVIMTISLYYGKMTVILSYYRNQSFITKTQMFMVMWPFITAVISFITKAHGPTIIIFTDELLPTCVIISFITFCM